MTAFPFDALLAETRWLSGLARQLAGNEHDAADLVQDTLLTAAQQPVDAERPVRGWLRTVLLSRFHDRHRRERALRTREDTVARARGEAEPAADVVQKAEAHRRLVEAVLALDEPLCTCVLLRFFENLPPRAIAARTGAPVATVHSRLQRGLAQLRARLADEHGPRWRRALAPLLLRPSTLLLGVPLVHATVKAALGAAVLLVASVYLLWPDPPLRPDALLAAADRGAAAQVAAGTADALASAGREEAERLEVAPPPAPAPTAAQVPLRGRVLDARGAGVAAVTLGWRRDKGDAATQLISGPDGGFELAAAAAGATLASADRRWSTVLMGLVRPQSGHPCTVVVAPRIDVAGRVVDGDGAPVPAVAVSAHMPKALGTDFGVLLDFSTPREWQCVADAEGRFRLDDVPSVATAFVLAELGGWLPRMAPLPTASTEQFELVLERPGAAASLVAGVVVDRWGAAVAGARVSAGGAVARSDAQGAFTLDVSGDELGDRLVAVADGMQPALHVPERDAAGKPRWPARVVLQLGPPPLSLAGRVMFADGKPAAGAKVWINDPTVVGIEGDAVLAEHVLTGQERFWVPIVAGDDGSFRLDGLADRAYTVRALDPRTLLQATMSGLAAGRSDVELRLPGEVFPRLVVRVATRDGEPVKNVHVRLQRPALEVNVPGGTRDEWSNGQTARTDERGECTFTDVPTSGVELFTFGDEIMFAGRMIGPDADATGFVLTVDRRMHLQVDVAPPFDRVDQCRVLDVDGKPMLLRIIRGNASRTNRTADVQDGKSHILSLGEGARTVAFFCKGQEVGRMPVQLVAREVTTVRF